MVSNGIDQTFVRANKSILFTKDFFPVDKLYIEFVMQIPLTFTLFFLRTCWKSFLIENMNSLPVKSNLFCLAVHRCAHAIFSHVAF